SSLHRTPTAARAALSLHDALPISYYSLSPELDVPTLQDRIAAYVAAQGWRPAEVEREETGVLPVAMGGDVAALWQQEPGIAKLGDRKSTRLNSSHVKISYAVFCLK